MKRLSELPGRDVYTDDAKYLGKAHDFIIDLQKGEIARLTIRPIDSLGGLSPQWIRENTISFKNIESVADIIIVSSKPKAEAEEAAAPEPSKSKYSFAPAAKRFYK
ncbi:hypothetical protein AUJ14_01355 [Candidatus Micrarchaeota archaeon CG1_02_55_22]|nr:MAG: hypothetical protein AUJ14_01355 [Candidatus Micrarchaeota archaeon CG1_02_55_22]